jgi:hypothetical protein
MPLRPFCREQAWLLPPSLDELLAEDHATRFVAAFGEGLSPSALVELEITKAGEAWELRLIAPVHSLPYGFMGS